jgi:hypothetical protein
MPFSALSALTSYEMHYTLCNIGHNPSVLFKINLRIMRQIREKQCSASDVHFISLYYPSTSLLSRLKEFTLERQAGCKSKVAIIFIQF